MSRVPDFFDMDDAQDDDEGVTCNRCGETGCYWQRVTQADGCGERSVLFDSATDRPHVCPLNSDDFEVMP